MTARKKSPNRTAVQTSQDSDPHYTGGIDVLHFIMSWEMDYPTGKVIEHLVRAPYGGRFLKDIDDAENYLKMVRHRYVEAEERRARKRREYVAVPKMKITTIPAEERDESLPGGQGEVAELAEPMEQKKGE
jgi:hypothetical protein